MSSKFIWLGFALIMGVVFGVAPESMAAQKEQLPKTSHSPKALSPPRWDTVLQAAKREGPIIVYTTANPTTKQMISKAMKDKYGITVDFIGGRGEELVQRITTENRAGLYLGDLLLMGMGGPVLRTTLKPIGAVATLDFVAFFIATSS